MVNYRLKGVPKILLKFVSTNTKYLPISEQGKRLPRDIFIFFNLFTKQDYSVTPVHRGVPYPSKPYSGKIPSSINS